MSKLLLLVVLIMSANASAGGIEKIAGRYEYVDYQVILPNGSALSFGEMGAAGAEIEIRTNRTLVLFMKMLDGSVNEVEAAIEEIEVGDGKGYWLARNGVFS